jgi:ParB family chromosome partitioning protein
MRQALGRGLEALLPKKEDGPDVGRHASTAEPVRVPISSIKPNRLQPRRSFNKERLSELSQTIKENGLVQPLLVSPRSEDGKFEIISGERRLRAALMAGLTHVDVVIRPVQSDLERLTLALVENVQRDDLNAIDEAKGYQALVRDHGVSQADLSLRVGKSKSAVSNILRLLELPEDIQQGVLLGQVTPGHARALLMVSDPSKRTILFRKTVQDQLSVREVENLARLFESGRPPKEKRPGRPLAPKPADVRDMEQKLSHSLGMKVELKTKADGKSGKVVIHFYSLTDFDKLLGKLR